MDRFFLDDKEEKSLEVLTEKYEKFIKQGLINKGFCKLKTVSGKIIPEPVQKYCQDGLDNLSELAIWKKVMKMAADGFITLQAVSSKYSINENDIIKKMNKINIEVDSIDKIKRMRSYEIEKIVNSFDWKVYLQNILQSAPCGAAGMYGLPFNTVLGTFIQFRTVQLIAMHYGYDIKSSQAELDYAGDVLIQIMMKGRISDADGFGETIAKMMSIAELTSLRSALKSKTYEQMAKAGGAQLLYAQMRAITNKAAVKALEKAGQSGIENKTLTKILEALSKKMTQTAGAKAIPAISAALNVLIDTYQIHKVLKIANVIYQKRFLLDKEMNSCSDEYSAPICPQIS